MSIDRVMLYCTIEGMILMIQVKGLAARRVGRAGSFTVKRNQFRSRNLASYIQTGLLAFVYD